MNTSTVVIGAGPYGLSLASHLAARGVTARVFGDPMSAWRKNMPEGMFLKSAHDASDISSPRAGSQLADYTRSIGIGVLGERDPIPIDVFVNYGLWFAEQNVPHLEQETVTSVVQSNGSFAVSLASGEVVGADSVVVASGHLAFAYIPPELVALVPEGPAPDTVVSHSSQHHTFERYAGARVAVVGAGQSALESAALLHEAGADVTVLVRGSDVEWNVPPQPITGVHRLWAAPRTGLGRGWKEFAFSRATGLVRYIPEPRRLEYLRTVLGPSGAWWLRDRVDGRVDIVLTSNLGDATRSGSTIRLAGDDRTLEFDHVVAGTGYRIDADRQDFIDPALRARLDRTAAAPTLDAGFQSSVPGLYYTGLAAAPTFGPALRFVFGTTFAARRLSSAVARHSARSRVA
jgi:thioredoxin reductase